ncbi:Crp/Fnr family transcriptional regulator [uncultured Anaerococcus sp.]|uniref:Crp/Fnr family transcriptional regulator n=1 Tax=uncultured Anaerococcus sp. TaxID=293428 RepID=UPI00262C0966|nr:Crp/Fnr family transcriptional regulator [uncultured Anaerococcus sp.]
MRKEFYNINLLEYISDDDLDKFTHKVEIKEVKKGEIIFRYNDQAEYMYIIVDGFIKISMYLTDGREQVLYTYSKGDFVGAHNLLTDENYQYEAKALKKTKLIYIHKSDFFNVMIKNNKILIKILGQSFKRIRRSEELIDRLVGLNADMKVAKLLLDLVEETKEGNLLIKPHLTREELGSYSGVVRETLSRKLSYFEDLGLIKLLPKGEILIQNIEALRKIVN